jgi:hypothetical protein
MRHRVTWCLWTAIFLVFSGIDSAHAQQRGPQAAITDIALAGVDYNFQGEYVGTIVTAPYNHSQKVGLQVVALGNGKFEAAYHLGGLPGTDPISGATIHLSGERKGGLVVLEGWPLVATLEGDRASINYMTGGKGLLGQLPETVRASSTLGAPPPCGAVVLFDGTNTDHFTDGRITDDGLLMVGTQTKEAYKNFKLHAEFRTPFMPTASGQARANSGIYLQSRYEVQILDSFGLSGDDNECGGLYRYKKPDAHMCLPPLVWQTYDIEFAAPTYDCDGNKVCSARLTVCHNGVLIHDNVEVTTTTRGGAPEGPESLPITFQNHGNPVHFRNIWLVDYDAGSCCRRCCGSK